MRHHEAGPNALCGNLTSPLSSLSNSLSPSLLGRRELSARFSIQCQPHKVGLHAASQCTPTSSVLRVQVPLVPCPIYTFTLPRLRCARPSRAVERNINVSTLRMARVNTRRISSISSLDGFSKGTPQTERTWPAEIWSPDAVAAFLDTGRTARTHVVALSRVDIARPATVAKCARVRDSKLPTSPCEPTADADLLVLLF